MTMNKVDKYETLPVEELIENARQLIYAMCQDGAAKHWRMSIPVQTTDSDIVLAAALTSAKNRIADLERHNSLLRAVANVAEKYDVNGKPFWEAYQAAIDGGALEEGE